MATTYKNRIVAKGTIVKLARAAAPTTFTRIMGMKSISGPGLSREFIDGTELDPQPDTLPSGVVEEEYFWKESYPGDKEAGEVTIELNMSWATYEELLEIFRSDELVHIQIVFRTGDVVQFRCSIGTLNLEVQPNAFVTTPVGFKPTINIITIDTSTTTTTTTTTTPGP